MDWIGISEAINDYERNNPTMTLSTRKNNKVIFKYPNNGRQADVERAAENLILNGEYTVETISIGGSTSFVELKEVPGIVFNTVHFTNKLEGK